MLAFQVPPIVMETSRRLAGFTGADTGNTDFVTRGMTPKRKQNSNTSDTSTMSAFKGSPIGMETSRRLAGFIGAGTGNTGIIIVGMIYRF